MPTRQTLICGTSDEPLDFFTEYSSLLGDGNSLWTVSEGDRECIIPTAGKLTNFRVGLKTAPGIGKSWVYTIRKGGAATALSVTISGANVLSALDEDIVVVAAGDRVALEAQPTLFPTACEAVYWRCDFIPNSTGETILISNNLGATIEPDIYNSLIGGKLRDFITFDSQALFPTPGTLKKFYVEISVAPGDGNSRTFTIRKNGVNTDLAVTISGGATTGNNTADTVDIVAGDKVNIVSTVSGSPVESTVAFGVVFLPDIPGEWIACATTDDPTDSRDVEYQHLMCGDAALTDVEDVQHGLAPVTTAKKIYVNLSTAPGSGNSWIFTLRKALASTALTVTISDTNTTGNAAVDEAVAADALVDTEIDATDGKETSKTQIAILFYNEPTPPLAGGGTGEPAAVLAQAGMI